MAAVMDDQAEQAAFSKQYDEQQATNTAQEQQAKDQPEQPSFVSKFMTNVGRASSNTLDWAVSAADSVNNFRQRAAQDVGAGITTAAVNTVDAVGSALKSSGQGMAAAEDPAHAEESMDNGPQWPTSPIWDHAKSTILDFRDAISVKDPTLADNVLQSGAQLAVPFAGYSRALAGVHGFANMIGAGAATDLTALGPHDPRMADMLALARHTEGKFGDVLRQLAPDGSAQNAYINYLTDRGDESEAEGRFKNVLDGFGANMLLTPLLHGTATVLKQGYEGLRYAVENGVGSMSDMMPANQAGHIAFHGTAADFDAFDMSKVGSGEGNQVFGHGLYFAENPETAGHYQQAVSRQVNHGMGEAMDNAKDAVDKAGGDRVKAYRQMTSLANDEQDSSLREKMQKAAQLIRSGNYSRATGNLMTVHIPDEHVSNMIDWDQPISKQPALQKVVDNLDVKIVPDGNNYRVMLNGKPGGLFAEEDAAKAATFHLRGAGKFGEWGAGALYDNLATVLGSQKAASEFLSRRGIPGIKYLDQGSRDEGKGTRNLVLFDAKHAKIIAKNGKSVAGQERTNMSMSPEERALERERVAAQRDSEEGVRHEPTPEPVPAGAAEREGAAARRRKDD